tara:strand:+ start:1525 stop:1749 length:225 start_codon:yes stop_codon:yes gene_type:complete
MKKLMVTAENPNGIEVELSAEEETQTVNQQNVDKARKETELADKQAKVDLKASAKAKLIAGEALTEDEADTIVL